MPSVVRPAMSDGRAFTNYLSGCEFENNLKQNFAAGTESEYRSKLQANPRAFDLRAKQYVDFMPYHSTSTCPKASDAQARAIAALPKRLPMTQ